MGTVRIKLILVFLAEAGQVTAENTEFRIEMPVNSPTRQLVKMVRESGKEL